MDSIVNKVAQSNLTVINLKQFLPKKKLMGLDISQFLFKGILVKEKEFRKSLQEHNWSMYIGHDICLYCSTDAILPQWTYLLLAVQTHKNGIDYHIGTTQEVHNTLLLANISQLDTKLYLNKKVILKGCSDSQIKEDAYLALGKKLLPVVQTLMYGEACSTVPLYKKK